jgi:hypothetical protein
MSDSIWKSITGPFTTVRNNVESSVSKVIETVNQSSEFPALRGINFEWCRSACSAELALSSMWSCLIAVKSNRADLFSSTQPSAPPEGYRFNQAKETVSLEARKYFDPYEAEKRAFISTRIGTSKNIGLALGLQINNPYSLGGLSLHVGAYTNMKFLSEVKPTVGLTFNWNY